MSAALAPARRPRLRIQWSMVRALYVARYLPLMLTAATPIPLGAASLTIAQPAPDAISHAMDDERAAADG